MKLEIGTPVRGFLGLTALFVFTLFLGLGQAFAQDCDTGEALFKNNCASCHAPDKRVVGPALQGAQQRWADAGEADALYAWVKNAAGLIASGTSARALEMESYDASAMTPQAVSNEDIDAIFYYVENCVSEGPLAGPADDCATPYAIEVKESGGNWTVKIVIACILAMVVFAMAGVNRRLKEASDDVETDEDTTYLEIVKGWLWRNKILAVLVGLVIVLTGLADLGWRAAQIDVVEGYSPSQPIAFSHIVHACKNEIDCKYCHNSVEKSKHAGIPSVNICMNCHRNIQKGTYTGTEEIAKIHKAAGFDAEGNAYTGETSPIVWNKVHNLPDHVYFNHSQHVNVGGIDCIQCHGDVKTYNLGKVASVEDINALDGTTKLTRPVLTMGWCLECHQETGVEVSDKSKSGYYKEIHERLKNNPELLKKYLEDDKITVRELGGWECAKCHY
jgi:mono/diheme cytochrome c family protein/ribosomal protein L37AE/L43A